MLRIATKDDLPFILAVLPKLIEDSRYKSFKGFFGFPKEAVELYLDPKAHTQRVGLIISNGEKDIGLVAFDKTPFPLAPVSFATITTCYIIPEERKKGWMKEVESALVYWGKRVGCEYSVLGISNGADPTTLGYKKFEEMFIKEIE